MTGQSRLDLYRARWRRWRAEPRSPEWHHATADIRSYHGAVFIAAIHRFVACMKDVLAKAVESLAPVFDAFADMAEAVEDGPGGDPT